MALCVLLVHIQLRLQRAESAKIIFANTQKNINNHTRKQVYIIYIYITCCSQLVYPYLAIQLCQPDIGLSGLTAGKISLRWKKNLPVRTLSLREQTLTNIAQGVRNHDV